MEMRQGYYFIVKIFGAKHNCTLFSFVSVVKFNLHSGIARVKTCHYEYLNAMTVLSTVIKLKREIPPAALGLPYCLIYISRSGFSLSLPL